MQSLDTTPRFRNLSINGTPTLGSTFDNDSTISQKSENTCFMCRQANIYVNPIGVQRERRVARRHPPPLSRAQIEELSQKKHLTKREVRLLLQCYFPEIKNVKYFQLHKFHSCCYDPKHMNLCKNHITALQHERADHGHHAPHKHNDEDHFREYERDGGQQNRVSFVRIKIEPTKGIPTRFLGPTALPESLADMLLKQVSRLENKKRQPSFSSGSQANNSPYNIKRIGHSNGNTESTASDYIRNLDSDDDDELSSDDELEESFHPNTANTNIYGYTGKSRDNSRRKRERRLQTISEKQTSTNGDLVVEDVEDLAPLFVVDTESTKKKKHRKRVKRPQHVKPKLNHWEQLALEQSQQQPCGCRHHVRRFEADKVVYDWCRCKDHSHKNIKLKPKDPPEPVQAATPPQKPKIPKKKPGARTIEPSTTEMALAYDPTTVDYDVIQEVLYFRTSSGRLVKPEISNSLAFNDTLKARGMNPYKSYTKFPTGSLSSRNPTRSEIKRTSIKRQSAANSPIFFTEDSLLDEKKIQHGERTTSTTGLVTVREVTASPMQQFDEFFGMKEKSYTENYDNDIQRKAPVIEEEEEDDEENEQADDDDEDENKVTEDFVPPRYLPQNPDARSTPSPSLPFRMQKSSKPTFKNHRPTPNFERESSLLANRRWYDQALGDQNLLTVHDGQFGLIAGSSAQDYSNDEKLPDNGYTEVNVQGNRGGCTIS